MATCSVADCKCHLSIALFTLGKFLNVDNNNLCGTCNHGVGYHPANSQTSMTIHGFEEVDIKNIEWKPSENTTEFTFYENVASALHNDEFVGILCSSIINQRNTVMQDNHFIVVNSPSGSGKTQMAFTIKSFGVPVLHLVMTESSTIQKIYASLRNQSVAFFYAVARDLKKIDEEYISSVEWLKLYQGNLLLIKFIFEYLITIKQNLIGSTLTVYSPFELLNFINHNFNPAELPIIFIDEALPKSIYQGELLLDTKLSYPRNLFRALGLLVVIMGTNSCAANINGMNYNSRGRDEEFYWCNYLTDLPQITHSSLEVLLYSEASQRLIDHNHHEIKELIDSFYSNCLPYFVALIIGKINSLNEISLRATTKELFELILCLVAKDIYNAKPLLRREKGLQAQIALFLNMYKDDLQDVNDIEQSLMKKNEYFVASHFAVPSENSGKLFLQPNGSFLIDSQNSEGISIISPFISGSSFLSAHEDPFLYLLLCGGKADVFPPPFALQEPNGKLQIYGTHDALFIEHLKPSSHESHANILARKRSGDILESLASISMTIASRKKGIEGLKLTDFIPFLIQEFTRSHKRKHKTNLRWASINELPQKFGDIMIPFLSIPNDPWPKGLLSIPGSRFGVINRTVDKERIDIRINQFVYDNVALSIEQKKESAEEKQLVLSCECKNYNKPLTSAKLLGIFKRIPLHSKVHLVFCDSMQNANLKKISFDEWRDENNVPMINFYKVSFDRDINLTLKPLDPEIPIYNIEDCEIAVIFLSLSHLVVK